MRKISILAMCILLLPYLYNCKSHDLDEDIILNLTGLEASQIFSDSAIIVWETSKPCTTQLEFAVSADFSDSQKLPAEVSQTYSFNHSIHLQALSADTIYYARALASTENGDESITSGPLIFRTESTSSSDLSEPVVGLISFPSLLQTTATIHWYTDCNATGTLIYATESGFNVEDGTAIVESEMALSSQHQVMLYNLTPNTDYYFVIESEDFYGTKSTSDEFTFTTAAYPPDGCGNGISNCFEANIQRYVFAAAFNHPDGALPNVTVFPDTSGDWAVSAVEYTPQVVGGKLESTTEDQAYMINYSGGGEHCHYLTESPNRFVAAEVQFQSADNSMSQLLNLDLQANNCTYILSLSAGSDGFIPSLYKRVGGNSARVASGYGDDPLPDVPLAIILSTIMEESGLRISYSILPADCYNEEGVQPIASATWVDTQEDDVVLNVATGVPDKNESDYLSHHEPAEGPSYGYANIMKFAGETANVYFDNMISGYLKGNEMH
jgi:hypothetical protein